MDAQSYHRRDKRRGPCPIGNGRRGSEQPAEARLAGEDHSGDRIGHLTFSKPQQQTQKGQLSQRCFLHWGSCQPKRLSSFCPVT